MLDITVNTLVRDGDEFLELCIETVLPYVKRVIITVDMRSTDKTEEIAERLAKKDKKIIVSYIDGNDPFTSLVQARNSQLKYIDTEFGFIIDADEWHPFIKEMTLGNKDAYGFYAFSPWTFELAHKATSRNPIGRIFRMKPGLQWRGKFGNEQLFDGEKLVFVKEEMMRDMIPQRYVHFTHVKKEVWRKEMGQERVADGRGLIKMPDNIIKKIYEKVPYMQGRSVSERLGHGRESVS